MLIWRCQRTVYSFITTSRKNSDSGRLLKPTAAIYVKYFLEISLETLEWSTFLQFLTATQGLKENVLGNCSMNSIIRRFDHMMDEEINVNLKFFLMI